jgi:hypothetical protein
MLRFNRSSLFAANDDGAGGGGGIPAAFDPAAFQTSLLGEVNKTLNGFAKSFKLDLGKLTAAAQSALVTDPNPDIDLAAGAVKPPSDPALAAQFKAMERQNRLLTEQFAAMQKTNEATTAAAEVKERHSSIRDTLAGFQFGSESQRDTAFRIFKDDIKRTADGSLVGGADEAPLKEYVTAQMANHAYLLAAKSVDSAGARNGGRQAGVKSVDFDAIKQGMSAADMSAAAAQISAVLAGQR